MKKLNIFLYITLLSMVLLGCKEFLDQKPYSSLTPENAFTSSDDWQKTLTACFGPLQNLYGMDAAILPVFQVGTDEVTSGIPWDALERLMRYDNLTPDHGDLTSYYFLCYNGIKGCNSVIHMPNGYVEAGTKDLMVAQAKFLRGVYYFELVRAWGGVPLWIEGSVDKDQIMKPRSTQDQVYTQVVKDMQEAENVLPETWTANDKGRPTKYAAQAMLARIYLQWGKPADALTYCNKVYGKFHLYENLKDITNPDRKNEEFENIFEIQFQHSATWDIEGGKINCLWGPFTDLRISNGGGWGGFGPSLYMVNQYDRVNDRRWNAWFVTSWAGLPIIGRDYYKNNELVGAGTIKWQDLKHNMENNNDNMNHVYIRYADVLLMKAEALNATNDAGREKYTCINQVRARAGVYQLPDNISIPTEQFVDTLLNERLKELCFERLRRWDLVRTGRFYDYMINHTWGKLADLRKNETVKDKYLLFPIPKSAMDANDAMKENNPGY
ncbi:MAG: RagB/SusD family nutrient uptake outer membrane protein [Mariniphaga sp.]